MSTFEKLFVRIFERKRWIVDQLKQHSELYDQSLASKCLINGIQPPSWLLSSGFEGGSADFKELKKEDLISGLLFPPPRPNYHTVAGHNWPLISENNIQDSDTLFTGTCASEKYLDTRDCSMLVPNCHLNEAITSPHQALANLSHTNSQLDTSRPRIQRSRSRQKTSVYEEVKSEKKRKVSYRCDISGRITRSNTSSGLHSDTLAPQKSVDVVDSTMRVSVCHLPEGTVSPPHQAEAIFSDINSQLGNPLERIQGSSSTHTTPVLLNNEELQSEKKRKESCSSSIGGKSRRSRISSGLPTDTHAYKKNFDAEDGSMQVSECHRYETISSPPYQTVAKLSDSNLPLDKSLARIQRSRSREKYAVLLTTEEGKPEKKQNESHSSDVSARITSSCGLCTDACVSKKSFDVGDSSLQTSECYLNEATVSPPRQTEARFTDVNSELDDSLARIQRSRSRQKALVLRSSVEVKSEKQPLGNQLRGNVNRDIFNIDMDPLKISFGETSAQTLDVANHQVEEICTGKFDVEANIVSVASNELGAYVCDEKSMSPAINRVANSSLQQNHEIPSRDHVPEYSGASDGYIRTILSQTTTPKPAYIDTRRESPYLLMNSMEPVNEDAFFTSDESSLDIKCLESRMINNNAPENSWPQYKRRKIEDRSSNVFTTSPILIMAERLNKIDKNGISELHRCLQHDLEQKHVSKSADVEASHLNVSDSLDARPSRSAKRRRTSIYGRSPTLETKEGDEDMEDRENDTNISKVLTQTRLETSLGSRLKSDCEKAEENGDEDMEDRENDTNISKGLTQTRLETSLGSRLKSDCEKAEENALGAAYVNTSLLTSEGQSSLFPKSELNSQKMEKRDSTEKDLQDTKSVIEDWLLSSSARSLNFDDLDLNAANQSIPVFEGFSMDMPTEKILTFPGDRISLGKVDLPSTTSERISVLETLCRYTTIHSPLPDSTEPKNHTLPDVYPSAPNCLLDCTDMGNDVPLSNDEFKQLESNHILASEEPDRASYSGCMPSLDVELDLGLAKPPCTPPVRMHGQRITSVPAHHSFEKSQTVNPELMCFRIDEDTCTSEENGSLDEVADSFHEDSRSPRDCISSSHRKPLLDMTNSETLMSISVSKTVHDRGSIDSVNTEPYMHKSQMKAKQNLRNTYGEDRRGRKDKENQNSSVSGDGYSIVKPRVSRKASSDNKSQSFIGNKGSKRGNIVSNVSSFVPLVQQIQKPAAFATGKRDVKVKALEAAEAAKRLEEKKENDRKMKKAAAKLERARLEEVKIKQMELKQKKEVEERKKKEAEMAARKRLREEDDRKENERKRKCIEEARKDKKDHYKIRADKEKEQQRRAADAREGKKTIQTVPKTVNVGAESVAQTISEGPEAVKDYSKKVVNNVFEDDANNRFFLLSEGNGDPSYDISPYQVSDDEEEVEEDDHVSRKKKFIPSWAREKSLASIMPYMERVDPYKIFLPTRASRISTVLSRGSLK